MAAAQRADRRGVVGWTLAVLGPAAVIVGILGLALGWGSSSTPASSPAPTSPPAATAPAEKPAAFLQTFLTAIRDGDTGYLVSRLDPVVVNHFGAAQCAASLKRAPIQPEAFRIVSVGQPGVFVYRVQDGFTARVPGVSTFTVRGPVSGIAHFHFARLGGRWYWFTDCGTGTSGT